jgi:predicted glycosyltransferase
MRRIALYSHDAQGLGHMRRNLAIADALAEDGETSVLLVTGARQAGLFPLPRNTDLLTLPALRKGADSRYRSRSLGLDLREMVGLRSRVLESALTAFAPDVFVVDKLPGGVESELLPCLGRLKDEGTRLVLGLREVLDDPARVRRDWQRSSFEAVVRAFYDAIWVYGDPRVYDPVQEYGMPQDLAARVRYSGYIDRRQGRPLTAAEATAQRSALDLPCGPIALAMAGGGEDGFQLLEAFARSRMPAGTTGLLVTGPMMPDAQREALEALAEDRDDLRLIPFAQDGDQLIRLADRVVCMAGYNTTCEVLASGSRALLVPRVHPRVEQLIRAERLAELGVVDLLHPQDLSAGAVSAWLATPLTPAERLIPPMDLGGLRRLPALLADVLRRPTCRAVHEGLRVAFA